MSFDFKHDDHSLKSNTMGDTSGAVTAYPPEASQTSHSRFVNSRYIFFVWVNFNDFLLAFY
jgi:hypothetical protein